MPRKTNITTCSIGPEIMRAFGDVCELIGRLPAAPGTDAPTENPNGLNGLLAAHKTLMGDGPGAGELRSAEARILRGARVAHVPPVSGRVPLLMNELMEWLPETEEHPVIASCVFHYHMLCIHPFADGNGRLARFWHALILETWRPALRGITFEEIINERKDAYLDTLELSDRRKDAAPFTLFMLGVVKDALENRVKAKPPRASAAAAPRAERIPEMIERLLFSFDRKTVTGNHLMKSLGMSHRGTFRKNYLDPALDLGLAEMTQPDSPRSPTQKYRLTPAGKKALAKLEEMD